MSLQAGPLFDMHPIFLFYFLKEPEQITSCALIEQWTSLTHWTIKVLPKKNSSTSHDHSLLCFLTQGENFWFVRFLMMFIMKVQLRIYDVKGSVITFKDELFNWDFKLFKLKILRDSAK